MSSKIQQREKLRKKRVRHRSIQKAAVYVTPALVVLIVLLGLYLLFVKYSVFNISGTEIEGANTYVSKTDLEELIKARSYGANLITFNTQKLRKTLLNDFQGAREISVSKKYPSSLKIKVWEREPRALVYGNDQSKLYLVDSEGYVLGRVSEKTTNLPKIFYDGEIAVGFFLNKELMSVYFELINAADIEKISASSVSIYSEYLVMYVEDSIEVLIGKSKDKSESIRILSNLLEQLKTEGKSAKRVDLRYDKVVVSYN